MRKNESTLELGTILSKGAKKYKIEKVLGQGGYGITYLASSLIKDKNIVIEAHYAIKEFFPTEISCRVGNEIRPKEDKTERYRCGMKDFTAEAQELHTLGCKNANIVKVNETFEENGTVYYVMQYINGCSLADYVMENGPIPYKKALSLLAPIFDAVNFLHKSLVNHLDIKPENIMLTKGKDDLSSVLIDFGASLSFKKNGEIKLSKNSLPITEGYSPIEQYGGINKFSPATDIYALAATVFFAVTGKEPEVASELRLTNVREQLEGLMPDDQIDGICKAFRKDVDMRTASISELMRDLGISKVHKNRTIEIGQRDQKVVNKRYLSIMVISASLIGLAILAIFIIQSRPQSDIQDNTVIQEGIPEKPDNSTGDTLLNNHPASVAPIVSTPSQPQSNQEQPSTSVETSNQVSSDQNADKPIPTKPTVTQGELSLDYGKWVGGIKNGKPDGRGCLTFNRAHTIAPTDYMAQPGDYFNATYENGHLVSGKLYDSTGTLKKTIIP